MTKKLGAAGLIGAAAAAASLLAAQPASAGPVAHHRVTPSAAQTQAQVPWGKVGPGWWLATYSKAKPTSSTLETLYLVAPSGAKYALGHLRENTFPISWSGKTALIEHQSTLGTTGVSELDLATGKSDPTIQVSTGQSNTQFFSQAALTPNGNVLIGYSGEKAPDSVKLLSPTGKLIRTIETSGGSGGQFPSIHVTPAGQVAVSERHSIKLYSGSGTLVRQLAEPTSKGTCEVSNLAAARMLSVGCFGATSNGNFEEPWLVPVSGGHAIRAMSFKPTQVDQFGATNTWVTSNARYVQLGAGCGVGSPALVAKGGAPKPITISKTSSVAIYGTAGSELGVHYAGCMGGNGFGNYNPATHKLTALLGGNAKGGGYSYAALMYGEDL